MPTDRPTVRPKRTGSTASRSKAAIRTPPARRDAASGSPSPSPSRSAPRPPSFAPSPAAPRPAFRSARTANAASHVDPAPGVPAGFDAPAIRGCTCFRVRRLARRVTQIYDRLLAPSGLRVTQFSLLSAVLRADAMPIGALALALDMDRTTLTRNLKPLVDAGLLSLVRSSTDARQREARVTAEGRARHAEARHLWRHAEDEMHRILGAPQVASLHRLFDGLIETLDANQRATPTPGTPATAP